VIARRSVVVIADFVSRPVQIHQTVWSPILQVIVVVGPDGAETTRKPAARRMAYCWAAIGAHISGSGEERWPKIANNREGEGRTEC